MKKITIIMFIVLVLAAGIGLASYARMTKKGTAVSTEVTPTLPVTTPSAKALPSPIPTVAQIPLTVTSPISGSFVTSAAVTVKGKTTPKAEVFINDSQVVADAQGNFSVPITLDEGENTIVVTANDATGNYSEQDITITYDLAQ
jgi:hypothetical protein